MRHALMTRRLPFALSLIAGMALWEIVGRNSSPAFLVPLSATLERLWQLLLDGTLLSQMLDSASLFLTGFLLSLLIGMPAALLLARLPVLRTALEPYIMILYATPMVALIPFILSLMGFGFVPKVLVVFLFGVFPIFYNTLEGAQQHQAGNDRSRPIVPLQRMGAVARRHAALHSAIHHDGHSSCDRSLSGRHDCRGIFSFFEWARAAHHERLAEFRYRQRVCRDPGHLPDRRRTDAARAAA